MRRIEGIPLSLNRQNQRNTLFNAKSSGEIIKLFYLQEKFWRLFKIIYMLRKLKEAHLYSQRRMMGDDVVSSVASKVTTETY